jgi:pyruvate dehydrogenase E2 component (dihydrolipoamide acetyltransferase)
MAEDLYIPKLGQTVEQVTIINWLVKDGDKVSQGQPVLEVETDKAVFTVDATADGVIHLGPYQAGDVVANLTVVAIIGLAEDKFTTGMQAATPVESKEAAAPEPSPVVQPEQLSLETEKERRTFISPRAKKLAAENQVDLSKVTPTGGGGMRIVERDILQAIEKGIKVSPVAARIAQEAGLDLGQMRGSGLQGEITKSDVEEAIKRLRVPAPGVIEGDEEVSQRVPLKGIRALIAERMSASVHSTARFTLFIEVDATRLVRFREDLKTRVEKEWGFAPSYNDLIAKIATFALRAHPYMNARLAEDAIEHLASIHIGMATDTERGLMVPVIRNADQKTLLQFGSEFRQLVEKARSGRIHPDDLQGGTFTITNLGMYDILTFVPVINLPEAAILAVGKITPKPVAVGDAIAVRQMWMLGLVVDHRVVDGGPAAKFLQWIKDNIENPDEQQLLN